MEKSGTKNILEISKLHVAYGAVKALHGISLAVPIGSIVTLIGANGAGKSTVLRAVSGLKAADSGEIRFRGASLAGQKPHAIVRLGVVQCPEGRGIFPDLKISENLDLGAYTRDDAEEVKRDLDRVFELFPLLAERRHQPAGTLSGGEQQMLAIARSLMADPALLLLDEPSLGLAPQIIETIFETIRRINAEGVSILLVEQNANLALETASEAYVLETGRLTLQGHAAEVAKDARVKAAYLGH